MKEQPDSVHQVSDAVVCTVPGATPLPWRRGSDDLDSPELFSDIYAPNGFLIVTASSGHERGKARHESIATARANARLIVRAVNSHAALVSALRGLLVGCEFRDIQGVEAWHRKSMPSDPALDAARAALALATKEPQ